LETGVGVVIVGRRISCRAWRSTCCFETNEAIVRGPPGRLRGKSFALMAQEDFGGFGELAALQAAELVLDVAELVDSFLELAGEARAVQSKRGQHRD